MTGSQLPKSTSLLVCPVCGRTDRFYSLKGSDGRHYSGGRVCSGIPRTHHYVLAEATDEMVERATEALIVAADFEAERLSDPDRVDLREVARRVLEAAFSTEAHDGG